MFIARARGGSEVEQTSLDFDARRLARKDDPATSKNAAGRVGEFKTRHIALIWNALESGPMTKDEIAAVTRLTDIQVARRGKEMSEAGLVMIGPATQNGCRIWRRI